MRIYDISMTIDANMPVYKNKDEKKPRITVSRDFSSSSVYESRLEMDMHTGTHIDMPLHTIPGGAMTDTLDIARLVCECLVLDLTNVRDKITARELEPKPIRQGLSVLLKTRSSFQDGFDPEFVYLEASGAEYLKKSGVTGVGIDALGIERAQPGHETHNILFGAGIIIIEGLRLSEVTEGFYRMVALPLKISGVEAAPARVILLSE